VSNVHYLQLRFSNIHSSIPAISVIVPVIFLNNTLKEYVEFPVLLVIYNLIFMKTRFGGYYLDSNLFYDSLSVGEFCSS
jgi:hypothetical protein